MRENLLPFNLCSVFPIVHNFIFCTFLARHFVQLHFLFFPSRTSARQVSQYRKKTRVPWGEFHPQRTKNSLMSFKRSPQNGEAIFFLSD